MPTFSRPLLLPVERVTRPTTVLSRLAAVVKDRPGKQALPARKPPIYAAPLPFSQYRFAPNGDFLTSLGSCVGCAFAGFLDATPFPAHLDQAWAETLWEWCRNHDGARDNNTSNGSLDDGTYPGTAVKRLKQLGLVDQKSGLADTEKDAAAWSLGGPAHLPARVVCFGVSWFESMDLPRADGFVEVRGKIRGGHEFIGSKNPGGWWDCFNSWRGYGPFDALGQHFKIAEKPMRKLFQWGATAHLLTKTA
jgi:hypothetical protein